MIFAEQHPPTALKILEERMQVVKKKKRGKYYVTLEVEASSKQNAIEIISDCPHHRDGKVVEVLDVHEPRAEKVSIASQDISAIEKEVSGLRSQISILETNQLAACDLLGNLRNYLESTSHEVAHRTETMVALTDAILKLLGDEE